MWTIMQSVFNHAQRNSLTGKHGLVTLSYNMEQSNYFVKRCDYSVEQSDYYVEQSNLEQSEHGTK